MRSEWTHNYRHAKKGFTGFFLVLGLTAAAAAVAVEPRLTFDGEHIEVSGVTPGGAVVAFGAGQEHRGWLPGFRWFQEILHDHDSDGVVDWEPATPLPAGVVWIVVDFTTGAYSSLSLSETQVQTLSKGDLSVPVGAPELVFRAGRRFPTLLAALLVRPGQAAWAMLSADGATTDLDGGEDGSQRLRLADFTELAEGPAVHVFEAGDVLVVVELRSLSLGVWQVEKGEE